MKKNGYIAIDLGASSGRLMLGIREEEQLILKEIHRFENEPVYLGDTFYWDFPRLFSEIKTGLRKAAHLEYVHIKGIGVDTWGVDGAFLDKAGRMLSNPVHYRDQRTMAIVDEVEGFISSKALYQIAGIQKMNFNTIYQLYYDLNYNSTLKQMGNKWLFTPDLIHYFLTGQLTNEYTICSTSSLIDATKRKVSQEILDAVHIDRSLFSEMVKPGQPIGKLSEAIQQEVGLEETVVVAVATHDTASAITAIPFQKQEEQVAYLCTGTWCLMGMLLDEPILTEQSRSFDMTNEGGAEDKICYLKNLNGLWFLQQLRKAFKERGLSLSFGEMSHLARASTTTLAISVSEARFMAPLDMEKEIISYCKEIYNVTLVEVCDIIQTVYNGLLNEYKIAIKQFEEVTKKGISTIYMVGGGIQDTYLCEQVAKTTQKRVIAGPIEASSIGNILVQMKALGEVESLEKGHQLVRNSFEQMYYE